MERRALLATFGIASVIGVLAVACGSTVKSQGGHAPDADGGPNSGGTNSGGPSSGGTSSGGSGGIGAGGKPALGTGGAPVPFDGGIMSTPSPFGGPCLADADCSAPLKCLQSTSNDVAGGGPPNGLCTLDCTADFNASTPGLGICQTQIALDAVCLTASSVVQGKAFCFPGCMIGDSSPSKCLSRLDMACTQANFGTADPSGYCTPRCRNDADCGNRKCSLLQGVCVDVGSAGLPIGASCRGGGVDPCAGYCFPLDVSTDAGLMGPGFCSAPCRLGSVGCGATLAKPTAACLFAGATSVQGDEGACAPLCNCNDDCIKGLLCRPFTSAAERTAYGRRGYCGDPVDAQTGGPAVNLPCASTSKDAGARETGASSDAGSDAH